MKYKFGMYGGSFEPLTIGHTRCILTAASMCEELSVIICYSNTREHIDPRLKYRWIHNLTKHIGNVRIYMVDDKYDNKETYDWEEGRDDIIKAVGHNFDAVFSGIDHKEEQLFEKLYPDAEIVYFDFDREHICSTAIRKNPYKNWDIIPDVVKPYYVKKVCFLGGESTGKTILSKNLSILFNTSVVEEEGRFVCEKAGTEDTMIMEDFANIMLKHKWNELQAMEKANKILFIDTEVLTTKWFFNFLCKDDPQLKNYNKLADAISSLNSYDLVFFCEPDVAFIQDGTRNEKIEADRKKYSEQIKSLLNNNGIQYEVLSGSYDERLKKAYSLSHKLIEY